MTARRSAAAFCLAAALGAASVSGASASDTAILIATWRGCEEACKGFIDYIEGLGRDVEISVADAAQDKSALPEILAQARSSAVDLIVSWGTSVTEGIAGRLEDLGDPAYNQDIPQVFMIVADPVGSGIIGSLEEPGRPNITGTYNRMPETVTIDTIRRYLPGFDSLGLLYNANEPNSLLKLEEMKQLSESAGFELVALPIALNEQHQPLPEDIGPKMRALAQAHVDFVYVGSSSFLQANSAIMGGAAMAAGLPLLSPYEEAVQEGNALISVAANYYEVGRLAGQQAEKILFEGLSPGDLSVARMKDFAVTINMSVARDLGLFPPIELLQIAEIVE